jgi:transmembrane sensor
MRRAAQHRSLDKAARRWVVHLHSGAADGASRTAFEAWLRADPAHAVAYRDCEQLMEDLSQVSIATSPLRRPARAAWPRWLLAQARPIAAAFLVAACLATAGLFLTGSPFGSVHPVVETQISEIKQVVLPDGSRVTLGGRSRLTTHFTADLRVVSLSEGEAFFDVAPDKARPFYVQAGDRLVRVVGTRFDVRQSAGQVHVSVEEGIVEVFRADNAEAAEKARPVLAKSVLRAGDQVVAHIGADDLMWSEVDPEEAAPWRRGWLSYEDASLSDIVSDANRYSPKQIEFAAEELKTIRVTASFGSDRIDQFIAGLEASHPIDADRTNPERIILRNRN